MRKEWAIAGFIALAVVAAAGWLRKPAQTTAYAPALSYEGAVQPVQAANPCVAPNMQGTVWSDRYVRTASYVGAPVYESSPRSVSTVRRQAPAVVRTVAERDYQVRQRRSTGKSVAIVAGSAGVGAAIGALAGGGKGAAIGALSGGTAGFIYDRLTR
jgi:hypothetical protein